MSTTPTQVVPAAPSPRPVGRSRVGQSMGVAAAVLSGYAVSASLSIYAVHYLEVQRWRDWKGLIFAEASLWIAIGVFALGLLLLLGIQLLVPKLRHNPLLLSGVLALAVAAAGSAVASVAWVIADAPWLTADSVSAQRPFIVAAFIAAALPAVVTFGFMAVRRRRARGTAAP